MWVGAYSYDSLLTVMAFIPESMEYFLFMTVHFLSSIVGERPYRPGGGPRRKDQRSRSLPRGAPAET